MERSGPSKLKLIAASAYEEDRAHVVPIIYDSFRSYKNDRCAIFMHHDETGSFLASSGIDAEYLDPNTNVHWQGVQTGLKRKWKRIIIGDYLDWFSWYMKWQRFNAFHTVVLFRPISRMAHEENRGYMDGLLTRLLNKPSLYRVIVIEEASLWPIVKQWMGGDTSISTTLVSNFGREEVREAILSTLYGTRLSHTDLAVAMGRTLSAKLNPEWRPILQRTEISSLIRRRNNFRVLTEDGMKMVQSLSNVSIKLVEPEPRYDDAIFQLSRKREHLRGDDAWIEEQILHLVEDRGWFTIAVLYDYIRPQFETILRSSTLPPRAIMAQLNRTPDDPPMVNLPSKAVLRRVAERMVEEQRLARSKWFKEVGRPSVGYHKIGFSAFDQYHRCGQCAFYAPLRRRCRLWWLLDRAFGPGDRRWSKEGLHPLSPFEFYKMRNSWRISPHSSACARFTDKKKDHSRKEVPEVCEICNEALPESKSILIVCRNCRTLYITVKRHVRVFTAYEHKFEWNYREIAGRDSTSDVTRLEEERQASPARAMEQIYYDAHRPTSDGEDQPRTLMLYPGDRMLVKDGVLYIFKRRNVEAVPVAGTTLVDNDVIGGEQLKSLEDAGATIRKLSGPKPPPEDQKPRFDTSPMVERAVVERPEFARGFALAMARSAIHATERIVALPSTPAEAQHLIREQRRLFERLEQSGPNGFLTSEALIMKQYWRCFNLPLRSVFERFGPRKRSRFVRESVTAPSGRARGYSAVDAAINYLHQRRLSKCRQANMRLGLDYNPGEGFLHRRRWNSDGLGLLLDLIDPFKFADREKLLEAVSQSRVNWRDFHSHTDRHGIRFYYPKEETVGTLESVGAEADVMVVEYAGRKLPLMDAYQSMVSDLIESLRGQRSFTPFVY
ncbi:MAG: hypothetical protein OK474_00445 [Thaumarchaeota archaeon]|nr:hypothetical protein [Nitrososphaerota archaeon]